jgi:hypothetical protein
LTEVHPLDRAVALAYRGQLDEAEAILHENRADARAQFNIGWHECRRGLWHNAAVYLDVGRMLQCYGSPPLRCGKPVWNEFPLEGKTLHLRCEGGYGDEIIGVRWAKNFAGLGARVHVSCSPGLASLFARVPGVSAVTDFRGADYVHCDYWMPAMSCMRWFEPDGKPYLAASHDKRRHWEERIGSRRLVFWEERLNTVGRRDSPKRVGIKWAGNPRFEGEQHRRFPIDLMLQLARDWPEVQFYSLQCGNDLVDLSGTSVVDLGPDLKDWDETAAAVSNLDLVISSCTGVAHCAAAIGVPTWVVVPVMPYYLWAVPGERSVWYDSVRLFRQKVFGEWEHPFQEISQAMFKLFSKEELRHVG